MFDYAIIDRKDLKQDDYEVLLVLYPCEEGGYGVKVFKGGKERYCEDFGSIREALDFFDAIQLNSIIHGYTSAKGKTYNIDELKYVVKNCNGRNAEGIYYSFSDKAFHCPDVREYTTKEYMIGYDLIKITFSKFKKDLL